jgi:hypothetical protein
VYAAGRRGVPPAPRRGSVTTRGRTRAELRDWLARELRALLRTDDVALLVHFALSLHAHLTHTQRKPCMQLQHERISSPGVRLTHASLCVVQRWRLLLRRRRRCGNWHRT